MARHRVSLVNLDALPDMFASEDIAYRCDREPDPATRRLMGALGVEVVVTAVSAHAIVETRDCVQPLCVEEADRRSDYCSKHEPAIGSRILSRADKVDLIRQAKVAWPDLTDAQRAERIGMTISAYRNLVCDPDGSKQKPRREGYRGECERCGTETRSDGTSRPSRLCAPCANVESKVWTREAVIVAIQEWAAAHDGEPPAATDWMHADPSDAWPVAGTVYAPGGGPFLSWNAAIEAAGFTPRPRGQYDRARWSAAGNRKGRRVTRDDLIARVLAWRDEHGRMPKTTDWQRGTTLPNADQTRRFFGGWPAMIAQIEAEHGSGRAAMGQEPTAPVEEMLAPSGIDTAPRELEAVSPASVNEDAARPDDHSGSTPESTRNDPDEPGADELAQIDADRQRIDAHIATLALHPSEVAKPEAPLPAVLATTDAEIIDQAPSFADLAAELEAAYQDAEAAQERLIAAGDAFRARFLPLALAVEGGWGIPLTEDDR